MPINKDSIKKRQGRGAMTAMLAAGCSLGVLAWATAPVQAGEIESLKSEMQQLIDRIETLEQEQMETRQAVEDTREEVKTANQEVDDTYGDLADWFLGTGVSERALATPITPVTTQQNYVTGGDFPGSFKLPGMDTSVAIYGFIKGDLVHNFGAKRPNPNLFLTGLIPISGAAGSGRTGDTFFGVNPSQVNIETRTPTAIGEVKTHIQFDMFAGGGEENSANEIGLGLRLAYGVVGGLTVGQDWTAFMDLASYPETADFEGPNAEIFSRIPQIKWTQSLGDKLTAQIGLDNPEGNFLPLDSNGDGLLNTTDVNNTKVDQLPTIVGNLRYVDDWGHFQLSGQVREIGYELDSTVVTNTALAALPTKSDSAIGYGAAAFLQLNDPLGLHPNDKFTALGAYGEALRYVIDTGLTAAQTDGAVNPTTGQLELETQYAFMAWYQHWWSDTVRSTVVYGHVETDPLAIQPATHFKQSQYLIANVFWSPWPRVNLGIEGQYGTKTQKDGLDGETYQIQATALWLY